LASLRGKYNLRIVQGFNRKQKKTSTYVEVFFN
jgi:hypothetical protein